MVFIVSAYRTKLRISENKYWISAYVSYDDCPEIRELYSYAQILEMSNVNYTINTSRTKGEL